MKMLPDNKFTSTKTKRVLTSSARDNGAKSTSDEELGTLPNSGENDERRPLVELNNNAFSMQFLFLKSLFYKKS